MSWHRIAALALLLLGPAATWASELVAGTPGRYVYDDPGYFAGKPLTVYYYKALGAADGAPVLIAMHGAERDAAGMRDAWRAWADARGAIVLAPEFDRARFPSRLYQMGGTADPDPSHWTLPIVERLFESLRRDEARTAPDFLLFGHSAGAQFVHRLMLWTPAAHVAVAVAANAGSYTLPIYAEPDARLQPPYVLDRGLVDPDALRRVFARRFIVMLGEADTRTDQANLPRAPQARAEGATRFERGQTFFAAARAQALSLGVPLAWQLVTVPGVGHDAAAMGRAAAPLLLRTPAEPARTQ